MKWFVVKKVTQDGESRYRQLSVEQYRSLLRAWIGEVKSLLDTRPVRRVKIDNVREGSGYWDRFLSTVTWIDDIVEVTESEARWLEQFTRFSD